MIYIQTFEAHSNCSFTIKIEEKCAKFVVAELFNPKLRVFVDLYRESFLKHCGKRIKCWYQ